MVGGARAATQSYAGERVRSFARAQSACEGEHELASTPHVSSLGDTLDAWTGLKHTCMTMFMVEKIPSAAIAIFVVDFHSKPVKNFHANGHSHSPLQLTHDCVRLHPSLCRTFGRLSVLLAVAKQDTKIKS